MPIDFDMAGAKIPPFAKAWPAPAAFGAPTVKNFALSGTRSLVQAVCYVRMSTDNQRYSIANQACHIAAYAQTFGFEIVGTYADEGKSGLTLARRDALRSLLADVDRGNPPFAAILVYDVSRWGRFQDPDEAAALELRCRSRGVAVHYCAEQFDNNGSLSSAIMKTIKRAMAGEYSRELSVKVHAGQSRIASLGYALGGPTPHGLRRLMLDETGAARMLLSPGERKCIQSDRIMLVPGPADEIARVRRVFDDFIAGHSETHIARMLNEEAPNSRSKPWTLLAVRGILTNERYIGRSIWNKGSTKLGTARVINDRASWVCVDDAIEPLIPQALFERARVTRLQRKAKINDDAALARLGDIFRHYGTISRELIAKEPDCPSPAWFTKRFGGLSNAYRLASCDQSVQFKATTLRTHCGYERLRLTNTIAEGLRRAGGVATVLGQGRLILNGNVPIAVFVMSRRRAKGGPIWRWHRPTLGSARIVIIARLDVDNRAIKDQFLVPASEVSDLPSTFREHNGWLIDAYRRDTLCDLFRLASTVAFPVAL